MLCSYGIQIKTLYGYKLVGTVKRSEKMIQEVQTIYLEEKANIRVIYYVFNFRRQFLLSPFCHFKIIRCTVKSLIAYFVEMQLKKNILKVFFGRLSLGTQTGVPVSETT